jgi:hypothetical protein
MNSAIDNYSSCISTQEMYFCTGNDNYSSCISAQEMTITAHVFQEMRVVLETMECFVLLAQITIRQSSPHVSPDLLSTACVLHGMSLYNTH